MQRLTIGLAAMLVAAVAATGTALAAFEAAEAKESSVTFEIKGPAVVFKITEKAEVKAEVTCEAGSGKGAVMEKSGYNGGSAKLDEPASVPELASEQVAFAVKLESCSGTIAGVKGTDTINTEKCQFELYDESETEGKAGATLSLRGAEKEKPCTMTIESSAKCKIEIKGTGERENEELESVKLHNGKGIEMEVEAGSEVKSVKTKTSGCKLAETPEGAFNFTKAVTVKGAKLAPPFLIEEGGEKANGRTFEFLDTATGNSRTMIITWKSNANNTKFHTITLTNIGEAAFAKGVDNCSGNTFQLNGSCTVEYKFAPLKKALYSAQVETPYKIGIFSFSQIIRDTLVGRGI